MHIMLLLYFRDDVPAIASNLIPSSNNAVIAPMCAAPFIPPPAKHSPVLFKLITPYIIVFKKHVLIDKINNRCG